MKKITFMLALSVLGLSLANTSLAMERDKTCIANLIEAIKQNDVEKVEEIINAPIAHYEVDTKAKIVQRLECIKEGLIYAENNYYGVNTRILGSLKWMHKYLSEKHCV